MLLHSTDAETLQHLVQVAQGQKFPDLIIAGKQIVNVYSGEVFAGYISISRGRIAYVGPDRPEAGPETQLLDAGDAVVCPGLIEPHTHAYNLYHPVALAEFGAMRGTTTIVSDAYAIQAELTSNQLADFFDSVQAAPVKLYWWLRAIGQGSADDKEERLQEQFEKLLARPDVAGLSEITTWFRICKGDLVALRSIVKAQAARRRFDGHTAGASYRRLVALAAAGTSGCHEAINGQEALNRLRLGYWTNLRFNSLRPHDLADMVAAIVSEKVDTRRLLMNMDAASPEFHAEHGFMEACIREAVRAGLPTMQAIQAVTVNAATYLGLDDVIGGIAPGRTADLVFFRDLVDFEPTLVLSRGEVVSRDGQLLQAPEKYPSPFAPRPAFPQALVQQPELLAMPATAGSPVPVMELESAVITRRRDVTLPVRDGRVDLHEHPDYCYVALIDRHGKWVTTGVIANLHRADAVATTVLSVGHLLVTGRNLPAMVEAAQRVVQGGWCVMHEGQERFAWDLPFAGMAAAGPFTETIARSQEVTALMKELGYPFGDVRYTLNFLAIDFLPDIRVHMRGLIETKTGAVIMPPQHIPAN